MDHALSSLARLAVIATLAAALAGCTSAGGAKPLSFGPASPPKIGGGNPILASLNGGILPETAVRALGRSDQLRALEAEYEALEKAPLGQKVAWRSQLGGNAGEVTAGTPYQVGQQNCRQYTHQATINGLPVRGQGAACRNQDGSWTPLG